MKNDVDKSIRMRLLNLARRHSYGKYAGKKLYPFLEVMESIRMNLGVYWNEEIINE